MASTNLTFTSREQHRTWLETQAEPPSGFRVGTSRFSFTPVEAPKPAQMTLTLIAADKPTRDFAAVFTRNAFPGAPVVIGRQLLDDPAATLGAIVINNKISNVCAPDGIASAQRICTAAATALGIEARQVLPSSTGVIGWRLPVDAMIAALPAATAALARRSVLPAAEGIMTTDLFPKVRRAPVASGTIVGIAKGAGMIEPNMGTLLVYLLTDLTIPRPVLQAMVERAVDRSFNLISIDSDTSTSDTVVALSSGTRPCPDVAAFERALTTVCQDLAEDVVRNGEGVHHVVRVRVKGCPNASAARDLGKTIVNSPLVKTAICGNDPNVGRFVAALGKALGLALPAGLDIDRLRLSLGGHVVFQNGIFVLNPALEQALVRHLETTQMYASGAPTGNVFRAPVDYPPHECCVELDVDVASGSAEATTLGADLSHEYISENADYRS